MFRTLKEDLDAVMERDPAARSRLEVFFLYSGFKAVRSHRKANWCYRHNLKFLARWISQRSRKKTGIEIHPGAQIGRGLFIDHGMGVVIGETTQIGDNCTLYQGVTLGGTGKDTGKRHPTLGDNVLIGAGAKVLGPFTVGDNARVAAGAVVLDAVPEGATAVGVPARVVRINGEKVPAKPPRHPCDDMDQIHVADPVSMELCRLRGLPYYIVARKSVKPYMSHPITDEVVSITTQKTQTLCLDGKDAMLLNGKRVAIVDDVISTGESLLAIERLVEKAGGSIVAKAAILAEGDAAQRDDIIFLKELPLFPLQG